MGRVSALVSTSARLGLSRLYGQLEHGSLPPRSRDEARASNATTSHVRSTIDEYVAANASTEQAASLGDFAAKPLVVLTAGSGSDVTDLAKQNDLATLSTNSVHRVIDGATHDSLISNEEHAATTTQAILDVVSPRSAAQGRWSGESERDRESISIHWCWPSTVLAACPSAPDPYLRDRGFAHPQLQRTFQSGAR
jgi:hypothetical protein